MTAKVISLQDFSKAKNKKHIFVTKTFILPASDYRERMFVNMGARLYAEQDMVSEELGIQPLYTKDGIFVGTLEGLKNRGWIKID